MCLKIGMPFSARKMTGVFGSWFSTEFFKVVPGDAVFVCAQAFRAKATSRTNMRRGSIFKGSNYTARLDNAKRLHVK